MASSVDDAMRYAPNHSPNAYMKNIEPNSPPEANEILHWFRVACFSASPRCDSYRAAASACALSAATTRAAPTLSVATAPAFSYAGLACCNSVVALIKPQVASPSRGTPARITSESFQEK